MRRFHSPGGAQRFLSVFSGIVRHFRPGRHKLVAVKYRPTVSERFAVWNGITGLAAVV